MCDRVYSVCVCVTVYLLLYVLLCIALCVFVSLCVPVQVFSVQEFQTGLVYVLVCYLN